MTTKVMPARLSSLHELLAFITGQADRIGLSRETQNRIELVAEEALVNIIKHAYASSAGDVEIRLAVSEGPALTVEIVDAGLAFNPLEKADPDLSASLEDRPVGGLGVFMMRQMADGLSYRRDQNRNILTLNFINR